MRTVKSYKAAKQDFLQPRDFSKGFPPTLIPGRGRVRVLLIHEIGIWPSDLVDTGLGGALCLFGGDIPDGGMKPLTVIVSFEVGEQVVPGGILAWEQAWWTSSVFRVPKQLSIGALYQQFPFLLMDWIIPAPTAAYWLPRSEWWIRP